MLNASRSAGVADLAFRGLGTTRLKPSRCIRFDMERTWYVILNFPSMCLRTRGIVHMAVPYPGSAGPLSRSSTSHPNGPASSLHDAPFCLLLYLASSPPFPMRLGHPQAVPDGSLGAAAISS